MRGAGGAAAGAPGAVARLAGSHCSVRAADSPHFPAHPRVSGLPGYSVTDSRSNTNLLEVYLLALIHTLQDIGKDRCLGVYRCIFCDVYFLRKPYLRGVYPFLRVCLSVICMLHTQHYDVRKHDGAVQFYASSTSKKIFFKSKPWRLCFPLSSAISYLSQGCLLCSMEMTFSVNSKLRQRINYNPGSTSQSPHLKQNMFSGDVFCVVLLLLYFFF